MRMNIATARSEEHTSELQSHVKIVCRLLLEKKKCRRGPRTTAKSARSRQNPGDSQRPQQLLRHRAWLPSTPDRTGLFFFNDTATTEIYTLSLHDALPI